MLHGMRWWNDEMWEGGQEFYRSAKYKLYCSKGRTDKILHDNFS
jgi:hypothetical protein